MSIEREFLLALKRIHDPRLENTDIEDVARAMNQTFQVVEAVAQGLATRKLIEFIGLGGNVRLTALGSEALEDPNWE